MSIKDKKKSKRAPSVWDKESCRIEALKYSTKKDFMKCSNGAYFRAYYNDWLEDICSHMRKPAYKMTREDCLKEAANYKDYWVLRKKKSSLYSHIIKNDWGEVVFSVYSIANKPPKYWTKEECRDEALKYSSRKELANENGTLYELIRRKKWLDEVCSHIPIKNSIQEKFVYAVEFSNKSVYVGITWNIEERMQMHIMDNHSAINEYLNNTTLSYKIKIIIDEPVKEELAGEIEKENIKKYRNKGWKILNRSKGGELGGGNRKWSKVKCAKIAKRYTCRRDFRLYNSNAYKAALRYKWIDDICTHMSRPSTKK